MDVFTDFPLDTYFGKGGMKKLMENQTRRTRSQDLGDVDSYQIIVWQNNV